MRADTTTLDIEVPSGRLRAESRGAPDASLLLCVPGLSANLRSFDAVSAALAGPDRRVVALDLRGRGRSEVTPAGTYGWPAHARDILDVAGVLEAVTFDLVGHSMGAFVAMQAAALAPARIRRLVLVDGAGRPEPASLPPILASAGRLDRVFVDAATYLEQARTSGAIVPWTPLWTDYFLYELDEVEGGVRACTSLTAVTEDMAHGAARDPEDLWAALSMPTLLLRAARPVVPGSGHIVSADLARRFVAKVAGATVMEVDAPHYTVVEHADSLAAIGEFLA